MNLEVIENEDLSKYTTVRIGGTAKKMLVPHSIEQLCDIMKSNKDALYIGGGSNLLIANREFNVVVNLKKFNTDILRLGGGRYRVGASARLQKFINEINQDGYGGIEFRYSVPGLVGGAVAMNAGRDELSHDYIGNYVVKVSYIQEGVLHSIDSSECLFEFRNSFFKRNPNCIIVSVDFLFEPMDQEESDKRKKDRIQLCKETQESEHPNFGSVFKYSSYRIMQIVRFLGIGKKNGVHYSRKTLNWLINSGDSQNYVSAKRLIQLVMFVHRIFGKKCELEVILWE